MRLIRILILALIALCLPLSAAMATGHAGAAEPRVNVVDAEIASSGHETCCDEMPEPSAACHVLPALIPVSTAIDTTSGRTRLVLLASPILPSGREPDSPLDPPRPA